MIASKQAFLIVGMFIVGLGSGVMLGMGFSHKTVDGASPGAVQGQDPRGRLARELGLSDEQQKQQKAIWDVLGEFMQKHDETRRQIDRDRDEAVAALFSPEQKSAYEKILDTQAKQKDELNKERDAAVSKAHDDFKVLLTEDQKAKYEEMLKSRPQRGSRGGSASNRGPRGTTTSAPAETMPATNK